MITTVPQQNNDIHQNKVQPLSQKAEQQSDLITPPMSPINNSLSTSGPGTARNSLKITAGQTGLPWLTHDGENYSPVNQTSSPQEMSPTSPNSPPPKFLAHPRTASIIRIPTRKRTMQKHIYSMRDGIDPVKVLCQRLQNWQISVKYLLGMFQRIQKVESNSSKGYRKIDITLPSKIEDQFRASHGVKDAWSAFRDYTRENSLIHQDFVDFIENEIVPILDVMIKDIQLKINDLKQDKRLRTESLWECRKQADKMITKLNNEIYQVVSAQEKRKSNYLIPKSDPLLTNNAVKNTIQDLHKRENRLHKDFLETQDNYRQFEQQKIINVYAELFKTLETYRVDHRLENLEGVAKVSALFSAIETDSEWHHFLHHNKNHLVKQTAVFKDERALDFPNASHPLVQPLMADKLQKRHGKKWVEDFYVLSPVGLLYRFKTEENFLKKAMRPDVVLYIPECTMFVNPTSHLMELRGKALGGMLGGKKKFWELSSAQPDIIKRWIEILGPMAMQQETAVINAPLPTQADVISNHSKVLAEEHDNGRQPETSKSGATAENTIAAAGASEEQHKMQPIDQHEFTPITNNPSHLANDSDDDDNYRKETVEYSTHTPIGEHPAIKLPDEDNAFVNNTVASTTPTATNHPVNAIANNAITANDGSEQKPAVTREDSDIYWDTHTSVTTDTRL